MLCGCSGSGTITAAALGAGGWGSILATELRPEWVTHAKTNLRTLKGIVPFQDKDGEGDEQPRGKRARLEPLQQNVVSPHTGCTETGWEVGQHDATQEYQSGATVGGYDAVVANPPWGKRIGQGTDSSGAIVRSLLRQFPTAVHVVFCPSLAGCIKAAGGGLAEGDEGEQGWEILHVRAHKHCPPKRRRAHTHPNEVSLFLRQIACG